MAQIIDGKAVSRAVRARVAQETLALKEQGVTPGLAVILVGEDPASQVYVRNKEKACAEVGFYSEKYTLPADTTQAQLNALVDELNGKKEINGILCQLPLPPHLTDKEVIARIDPAKDVDAFHPENVGAIMIGDYRFLPCTPAGVMELIRSTGTDLTGKRAVVVGRSLVIGKPAAMLLLQRNATVTLCHTRTADLAAECRRADVLIAAAGKAGMLGVSHIAPGQAVIDVGINLDADGMLVGDVDFAAAEPVADAVTPVPGGVGAVTTSVLARHVAEGAARLHGLGG